MTIREIIAVFSAAIMGFIFFPTHALCEQRHQKPIHLRLDYTYAHGGLKTAVTPAAKNLPRLGLALAGGGARAAASLGVLKALMKEKIPVYALAGTSMGAGVGGLFAAGYSPEEIEQIFIANDWNDVFMDTPARAFLTQEQKETGSRHLLEFTFEGGRFMPPSGLSAGQKFTNLLASKTLAASFEADLNFDKLKIPFRAVAADIETGETVVINTGLLHEAIRASTAIPLVFQPVEIQGRMLVDGGLVNNLPVDVVKAMGADIVIAVDSSSKLEKRERLVSAGDILSQAISIEVRRETGRQAALADMVITPDTSDYSFMDFSSIKEIIRKGEEAAQAEMPAIKELIRSKTGIQPLGERYRITSLTIQGNATVPDATIRYAMAAALFPRDAARDDILFAMAEVFKLGYFSDISLDMEKEGAGYSAVLTVAENPAVTAADISGNTVISSNDIEAMLDLRPGQPLNVTKLSSDMDKIIENYRGMGYLLARVERAGMKQDGSALEIALYEGRVDSITLRGQEKTRRSLIMREIKTRVGEPLNLDALADDIQHLYALNYFDSLTVDMAKSPNGGIDLTFKIDEKPAGKMRLGLRYDLEDSFTGLTDIVLDNLTGRGIKLYLNTRYGNYTDVTFGYHSPVFIRSYFVHSIQAFFRERDYFIYEDKHKVSELDITRVGAEAAFGYQWFRFGDTYLRYRYISDKTEEPLGLAPAESVWRIRSLSFLTTVDTRDSGAFARKGVLFKGSHESARPAYREGTGFTKTSLYLQANFPFSDRHTIIIEGSAGLGSGEIPFQEKFGIGGADYLLGIPLLGYERREFFGSNELGFSAAYRFKIMEYQLKVVKAVYINITGQAANVWVTREEMSFSDLKGGAGVGIHADTIIGPVRLDFGAGEDRRYAVYFSAGFDF